MQQAGKLAFPLVHLKHMGMHRISTSSITQNTPKQGVSQKLLTVSPGNLAASPGSVPVKRKSW